MWDWDALWLKAKAAADRANSVELGHPDFGLWSAFALELLSRATLSKIHPSLNADPRDERNLFYALGFPVVEQPRSLPAHSVYLRLEKLVPGFGKSQRELCDYMALRRNSEIHTGDVGFSPDTSAWLARFYGVCDILCTSLGKSLTDLFGPEVGDSANKIITAFASAQEKMVRDKISRHAKTFAEMPTEERQRKALLSLLDPRLPRPGFAEHPCPACGSTGVVHGNLIKELEPVYADGELLVDQQYLASSFECPACNLRLPTLDEVAIAGLNLQFSKRTSTDLHERFQPEYDDDYENM
jgi:hypothetical protein